MAVTDALRHAPRWAWVTAGGIGLGAAGIKLWNHRAKPASEQDVAPGQIGDPSSPYPMAPSSTSSPVATIVPPVIIGNGGGSDSAFGLQGLHDTYIGAVQSVLQSYADVWGPVQTTHLMLTQGMAETLGALAQAGSAPNSSPLPAALQPFPVAPAPVQQALPAPPPPPDPCTGEYPFHSSRGCYKVACASGSGVRRRGRWHLYNPRPTLGNGAEIWMQPTC